MQRRLRGGRRYGAHGVGAPRRAPRAGNSGSDSRRSRGGLGVQCGVAIPRLSVDLTRLPDPDRPSGVDRLGNSLRSIERFREPTMQPVGKPVHLVEFAPQIGLLAAAVHGSACGRTLAGAVRPFRACRRSPGRVHRAVPAVSVPARPRLICHLRTVSLIKNSRETGSARAGGCDVGGLAGDALRHQTERRQARASG